MFLTKIFNLGLVLMLFCLLLSACGPSPEELAATSAAETAAAATSTPTITPTSTSLPTPTPSPTATPTPVPDPEAMIQWKELGLPSGYTSQSPASIGVDEGDIAMGYVREDGSQIIYPIVSSFAFSNEWPEGLVGYTALFPNEEDIEFFDESMLSLDDQLEGIIQYSYNIFDFSEAAFIPEAEGFGDKSAGVEIEYSFTGTTYKMYLFRFRIGDIGGNVILRHKADEESFIDITDLGRIYIQSILNPTDSCELISVNAVEGETWPVYDIEAKGFYPGETRGIFIDGDVQKDKVHFMVTIAMLGLEGQAVDQDGYLNERITYDISSLNVSLPEKLNINIHGWYSDCSVLVESTWGPGAQSDYDSLTESAALLGDPENPIMWGLTYEDDMFEMISVMSVAIEYLSDKSGIAIEGNLSQNEMQFVNRLCDQEVHFGSLSPFGYLYAEEQGCAQNTLTEIRFGDTSYKGQILVNHNSGISGFADMKGKIFCRTSAESLSSWIIPSLMMQAEGVDPSDLYGIIDTDNTSNLISYVYDGVCDAGATYIDARTSVTSTYPDVMTVVQVLKQTIPIPYDCFTFSPELPSDIREELIWDLVNLESIIGTKPFDVLYGWDGSRQTNDAIYNPLRILINEAGVSIESLLH